MRLAFSKSTANEAEQSHLFTFFSAAGYDGLQLQHGQYGAYIADPTRFLDRWGPGAKVASGLIHGGSLDEGGQRSLRRVINFASAIGSERVIFSHGYSRQGLGEQDIREFAKMLCDIGHEARAKGIALSVHNHYDQPVMSRKDIDDFFSEVGDGAVALTLDTAHLVKSGVTDIAGVIRDWHCAIDNIHLTDYAKGEFVLLGEGDVNFDSVFAALHEVGYAGWLCADERDDSALDYALIRCREFLSPWLEAKGAGHS